jgi:hypothetical protein
MWHARPNFGNEQPIGRLVLDTNLPFFFTTFLCLDNTTTYMVLATVKEKRDNGSGVETCVFLVPYFSGTPAGTLQADTVTSLPVIFTPLMRRYSTSRSRFFP